MLLPLLTFQYGSVGTNRLLHQCSPSHDWQASERRDELGNRHLSVQSRGTFCSVSRQLRTGAVEELVVVGWLCGPSGSGMPKSADGLTSRSRGDSQDLSVLDRDANQCQISSVRTILFRRSSKRLCTSLPTRRASLASRPRCNFDKHFG